MKQTKMKKWKIIALIPAIFFLGIALFYPTLFKFKSPIIEIAIAIIGLVVFITISFSLYKSKKILLYIICGLVFTAAGYGIVFFHWFQSYPQIFIFLIMVFVLLSIIFWSIASYRIFKDLSNRIKR